MKKAKYRGIPCYFDLWTHEIVGRNWFYDLLLDLNIWFDINIVGVEGFPIIIEEE